MKSGTRALIALSLLSFFVSCGKDVVPFKSRTVTSLENLSSAKGNFRIVVTDAPFTYAKVSSAKVIVKQIEVKSTSDVSTTLLGKPIELDLAALKNGLVTAVVDLDLPPGQYKELMVISESGSIDLTSGNHYNLKIPSGDTSGIKVKIDPPINITTQASTDILLDFDLARSFVPQGDSKNEESITGFHFKPVVRGANRTTAGTVAGVVSSDNGTPSTADDAKIAGAVVSVMKNNTVISSAVTAADGKFKIIGLPQDSYSMEVSLEGYTKSSSVNFSITAGNVTTVDETLLAKLPAE